MRTYTEYPSRTRQRRRTKRRRTERPIIILAAAALLLVCISVVGIKLLNRPAPDPHEGQVYLYDGFDWVWMTPLEGVPVNELTEEYFSSVSGKPSYIGSDYYALRGIDVSEHQKDIDWQKASSGIDFAFIRVGRRGSTEGGLFDDVYFERNLNGARENGLMTGVYMFSQAVNVAEAIEEAHYILDRIDGWEIALPIVYDWEKIDESNSRTLEVSMETRTDCAVAFCETIKNAGYEPCVYFNRNLGYYGYDLSRLTAYMSWFSLPESGFPNFYYAVDGWQYSFTETVPGISVETDMSLWFVPLYKDEDEAQS